MVVFEYVASHVAIAEVRRFDDTSNQGKSDLSAVSMACEEKGHPLRYKRIRIRLEDGREVEAYTLEADQVRGKRRIKSGDYRAHVTPPAPGRHDGPWAKWARSRR
jgi:hypothetical protein